MTSLLAFFGQVIEGISIVSREKMIRMRTGTTKKIIPVVFIVVSLLYIAFGFSLEHRRMIGDEKGWDPGSRAMPLGVGFLMLAASIYLTLKKESFEKLGQLQPDSGSVKLISLTIMLSVMYIFFFRYVGFILATNILLFTLIYFNSRQDISWNMIPNWGLGGLFSTGFTLLIYSIGRVTTRFLFLTGKRSNIVLLTNRLVTTGLTCALATLIFLIALFFVRKFLRGTPAKILMHAVFIATGLTEFLYLVFRQVFWVSLAQGIITW